mgnify:CR=1 FL=1
MAETMTRRTFLKGAGAVGAASLLAAAVAAPSVSSAFILMEIRSLAG